jgi:hypothetical protein
MPNVTWLADVLRNAGLVVEEMEGWKTRGRHSYGGLLDVRAISCHHTAGPKTGDRPSLQVVVNGRPGLEGPLAQLYLSRAGTWVVVAAGKSNSNGQVINVDYSNAHTINVEAEAAGTGPKDAPNDWPTVQFTAYAKGVAAIAVHLKLPVSKVVGHKEIAFPKGRKIDPSFDMTVFRALVQRYIDRMTGVTRGNPRPAPRFRLARLLRLSDRRMTGRDVEAVQKALVANGIALPASRRRDGSYDGVFGPDMDQGVRRFQRRKKLADDGIVGPRTAIALGGAWTSRAQQI